MPASVTAGMHRAGRNSREPRRFAVAARSAALVVRTGAGRNPAVASATIASTIIPLATSGSHGPAIRLAANKAQKAALRHQSRVSRCSA